MTSVGQLTNDERTILYRLSRVARGTSKWLSFTTGIGQIDTRRVLQNLKRNGYVSCNKYSWNITATGTAAIK